MSSFHTAGKRYTLGALGAHGNFGLEWSAGQASWGGVVSEAVLKSAKLRRDNQGRLKRHQALKEEFQELQAFGYS